MTPLFLWMVRFSWRILKESKETSRHGILLPKYPDTAYLMSWVATQLQKAMLWPYTETSATPTRLIPRGSGAGSGLQETSLRIAATPIANKIVARDNKGAKPCGRFDWNLSTLSSQASSLQGKEQGDNCRCISMVHAVASPAQTTASVGVQRASPALHLARGCVA